MHLEQKKNVAMVVEDASSLQLYVQEIMQDRAAEIHKGFLETKTKKKLVSVKSVTDQFNFIYSSVQSLNKICRKF